MAGVQLFFRNVLAFALFVQSIQGHNLGCSTGECEGELSLGVSGREHRDDIVGYVCTTECRQAGYSYYWCDVDHIRVIKPQGNKSSSYYSDHSLFHNEGSDFWWNGWPTYSKSTESKWKWDYCSPRENTDITGNPCASTHSCGSHGYRYRWCYTNTEHTAWNYCGPRLIVKMPQVLVHCHDDTKNKVNQFCRS